MGVYTRKQDNKMFKTTDGKDVWICDRCEVAFVGSEAFFNHVCDQEVKSRASMSWPEFEGLRTHRLGNEKTFKFIAEFWDKKNPDLHSKVDANFTKDELKNYLLNWGKTMDEYQ